MPLNQEIKPNTSQGQIDLFKKYSYSIEPCAPPPKKETIEQKCKYEHTFKMVSRPPGIK